MARKAQRRGRGEGSFYWQESHARWVGEAEVDGRRIRAYGKDKTSAKAQLDRRLRELVDGTMPLDRSVTVASVVARFVERSVPNRREGKLAPSTRTTHAWAAQIITREIGTRRVAQLTTRHVEDMLDRLAARAPAAARRASPTTPTGQRRREGRTAPSTSGLGRASLVKVRSTLRLALDDAMRRREVAANVAAAAQLPGALPPATSRSTVAPADARRLLDALRDSPNGAMYALMLRVGLRPGEAAGLYWSSLAGANLTVSRAVQLHRGRPSLVDTLKTSRAYRTVELPADLVDWLAAHRKAQAATRLAAAVWVDPQLMFPTAVGTVQSPRNMRRDLAAICRRASLPVVLPNELRHSCASFLSDSGVRHEDIADLLGHTTTRMVDQTYRHRIRSAVDVAARADWLAATAD